VCGIVHYTHGSGVGSLVSISKALSIIGISSIIITAAAAHHHHYHIVVLQSKQPLSHCQNQSPTLLSLSLSLSLFFCYYNTLPQRLVVSRKLLAKWLEELNNKIFPIKYKPTIYLIGEGMNTNKNVLLVVVVSSLFLLSSPPCNQRTVSCYINECFTSRSLERRGTEYHCRRCFTGVCS
jgi:hypothetical protein